MMSWRHLWQNLKRSWRHHFAMQMATLVVLSATFIVLAVSMNILQNFDEILNHWGQQVQLTAYLKDDLGEREVAQVKSLLQSNDAIESFQYVSKAEAARRFQAQMGKYVPKSLLDPEFGNPLPDSFEIKIKEALRQKNVNALADVAGHIAQSQLIEDVSFGQGWVENYATLVGTVRTASWTVLSVLLVASLFVVGNCIRISVAQRREEIEIFELVGASPWWIKSPYIFEGAILGFSGSLVATSVGYIIHNLQYRILNDELGFWGLADKVTFLEPHRVLSVLVIGTLFGAFGAYLCVRTMSGGWSAKRRHESWS